MNDTQVLIPSHQLRWRIRWEQVEGLPEGVCEPVKVLQQGYRDTFGRAVWKDVPVVDE